MQLFLFHHLKHTIPFIPGEIYGASDSDLDLILDKSDQFFVKPDSMVMGEGIEIITRDELIKRSKTWTKTAEQLLRKQMKVGISYSPADETAMMKIVQPFYDTSTVTKRGDHLSIRSVVCNEKFVDAYIRYSKNPIVNLGQDAKAASLDDNIKDGIASISEMIVKEFLRITKIYHDSFSQGGLPEAELRINQE